MIDDDSAVSGFTWFGRVRAAKIAGGEGDEAMMEVVDEVEEVDEADDLPTMVQSKWKGLNAEHSYFINLIDSDGATSGDCSGTLLHENFMSSIKDNESSSLEL